VPGFTTSGQVAAFNVIGGGGSCSKSRNSVSLYKQRAVTTPVLNTPASSARDIWFTRHAVAQSANVLAQVQIKTFM
jgi:hypothetical protein